jgi:rubrerythrin
MSTELNILKVAILNEQEGYRFYREAAERVSDEEAKKAFLQLAQDERDHEEVLRKMFADMRQGQRVSVYDPEGGYIVEPRIFKRSSQPIINDDYELAVYKIGILMEEASERYYRESAEKTGSDEIKKMLLHLADWEASHRDALSDIYERLREVWWQKEGL